MKIGLKNKGSSLIFVLGVALVFAVISGITVTAVVATTKSNSAEEEWEDLLYAAESGVDDAVVRAYAGEYNSMAEGSTKDNPIITSFNDMEVKVKVKFVKEITPEGYKKYYDIESLAKNTLDGKERIVQARINKKLKSGDLFKYSICGKVTEVESGSIMTGPINSSIVTPSLEGGSVATGDKESAEFNLPKYNFQKMDKDATGKSKVRVGSGSTLIKELDYLASTGDNPSDNLQSDGSKIIKGNKGVVKIAYNDTGNSNPADADLYNVYLINADELVLELNGDNIKRCMIICSGDIKMEIPSTIQYSYGSIIGKKVDFGVTGALQFVHPPYAEPGSIDFGHSPFDKDDIKNINKFIGLFANDWDTSGDVGTDVDYWGSLEYGY
ncbi:MAG: hypothetical protein RSD13_01395 [Clostridium sp.]|uniref:hypothetical protein n=1 Tax=Clostridium sp. TaxID=1506 RepID=UPI002FCAF6B6